MSTASIFVSSVQKELAEERRAVKAFIEGDPLLRRFLTVFLFEDLPAADARADAVYLDEVDRAELYVGIFGNEYGFEDEQGLSPTEREFDRVTERAKPRLIFVKGADDRARHPKMVTLVRRAGDQLIRRRFAGVSELTAALYASLVEHLERTGRLRTRPFDATACPGAGLTKLSEEKLRWFLTRARVERRFALDPETPVVDALEHLDLLDSGQPNHAAILLFGAAPQRFLPTSEVKCLHFHGTEVRKPIPSYQVFKGTVFELVDQAVDFVMSKVARRVGTRALGPAAPVEYELPREAVTEAIVNAVAHRDYASNASVQVMLFADRLEVWNPGELPPPLTTERLRRPHPSIPRNPLIADPLFLARYVEKAGTGTLDMIARLREAGLPEPEFRQDGGIFAQALWRDWLTPKALATLGLSERQKKAIDFVRTNARIGNTEYQRLAGVTKATATRDLEALRKAGVLRKVGKTGKGTHYTLGGKGLKGLSRRRGGEGLAKGSKGSARGQARIAETGEEGDKGGMSDRPPSVESAKPLFIDNRDGNTLARAITAHLAALRKEGKTPAELCVASCYFNPQGLELIAGEAQHVARIRLLLGADPAPEAAAPRRTPYDPTEPEFTRRRVRQGLVQLEHGLRQERDLLPFDLQGDRAIRSLLDFLRSGRIEVRRYEEHFLHAKAFVFRGQERGLLAGSANLTRAGLRTNLELVLGHHEDPLVARVETWFDSLWDEAVPFDLAAIYEELLAEVPPYLVYLKVLWHLYHAELAEEERETGRIPITTFQKHGVWRGRKILAKYGGVMVADGVGLGKTYTAGEIIRDYRERRQRVLLVCPASLRDTTWERFLNDHQLLVECLSFEELANDAQLGGEQRHLKNPLDDYALVVVDEAHNYRNPDTAKRAAILRRLLGGKRRDLLLLTATPVNNSLWDLYHLLRFFMKQDAWLADRGVLSIRERFEHAMREDPFNLSPDLLYPIIDATTVKRTRRFIKKHYASDLICGPDGRMVPIRFPIPVASSIGYDLDAVLPGFFARVEEVLMPADGHPLLRMARYQPELYPAGGSADGGDTALVGLLRSVLLKRFESSAAAFRQTLRRMIREHEVFLEALARGRVVRKEFFREVSAAEDEGEIEEILEASEHADDAAAYDVPRLAADVRSDLELLREMEAAATSVRPESDPKLAALVEELAAVAKQAADEALDEEDARQKRKVLVFSHYEDTIDWIEEYLAEVIARDARLAPYRDRVASVSGTEVRGGISRERALHGFAPVSTGALPPETEDRFDLLLCTDVLAEGMNLQQCRNVVNYDLPWNPMRLVQRHGRVDRIGSPHREVSLRTFFPDAQLDALLNLEGRVRRKLAQAAASVGVEETPIERGATGEQSFAETREEIEKLHRGDASIYEAGGTAGAAQTGEEYRQELRRGLEKLGEAIRELPWRVGSGMRKGAHEGHVFCATVGDRIYLRFVPFEPEGGIVGELGTCLRLLECTEDTPRMLSEEMARAAYGAWERARKSILEAWTFETDPANLQPRIRKLNRDVAAFLRANPPPDVDQERLNRALDAVESPWPRREENVLRLAWERVYGSSVEKARSLIDEIESIGAEPFHAPEPLPPITEEEIHLITWLALSREAEVGGG